MEYVELFPPKDTLKSYLPVLQNVTLFGNNAIMDVVSYAKIRSYCSRVDLLSYLTGSLRRGRFGHRQRREYHVIREAEIEILQLQAKKCKRLLTNHQRLGRGKEGFTLTGSRTSSLQNWETINTCCLSHPVCSTSYGSPMKLIHIVKVFGLRISGNDTAFED